MNHSNEQFLQTIGERQELSKNNQTAIGDGYQTTSRVRLGSEVEDEFILLGQSNRSKASSDDDDGYAIDEKELRICSGRRSIVVTDGDSLLTRWLHFSLRLRRKLSDS